ncbi:MAG: SHOCT domain-containing protein, partial [Spirochaetia bacterium]|nr:SHOCT domain-containing protein [Spirochaetia bacterium]
ISLFVPGSNPNWWPTELGFPSSVGAQNNVRYAFFPSKQRLAIDINGELTIYDTLNHQIGGVSQQQGLNGSITFTSQFGTVAVSSLPNLTQIKTPSNESFSDPMIPSSNQNSAIEDDIFLKIERLADLKQKGILTEEEFSSKKAELLARL